MSSINIKLYYYRNGERAEVTDIRRLRVPETISYEELAVKIAEAQDWVKNGNASFKYIDEENDLVQFSSDDEWKIALEVLKVVSGDKLLRVRVAAPEQVQREERRPWEQYRHGGWRRRHCPFFARCEPKPSQVPDLSTIIDSAQPFIQSLINGLQGKPQSQSASTPLVRHFGVICDGCEQQNIIGDRFKCNDCKDFDFCGTCFNSEELRKMHGDHSFTKISKPFNRCQRQAPPQEFDFSRLFSQVQEQAQEFNLSNLLNHPLAQQFTSQFNEKEAQEKIGDLVNQVQPILTELAQAFAGAAVAQEKPAQEDSQPVPQEPSAPQESKPVEEHVEEIVINDEPQAAPSQVFPYQEQLEQLTSMGFTDIEKVKNLLVQYSGNCGQVVAVLCN
jgi:hypothetical protein